VVSSSELYSRVVAVDGGGDSTCVGAHGSAASVDVADTFVDTMVTVVGAVPAVTDTFVAKAGGITVGPLFYIVRQVGTGKLTTAYANVLCSSGDGRAD
jgi:hypothetical protein